METTEKHKTGRPEKQVLSVDGVLRIIEASAKSGVAILKFGDLELNFRPSQPGTLPTPGEAPSQSVLPLASPPEKIPVLTDEAQAEAAQRELELSELDLRDQQLAELMITDPAEFERQMHQGELEDDESGADDEQLD